MSKILITKSDGTPTKSKVYAKQVLQEKGISEELLIEENGQFFYEGVNEDLGCTNPAGPPVEKGVKEEGSFDVGITPHDEKGEDESVAIEGEKVFITPSWETPVFNKENKKTELFIPNTDVIAVINAKHPAGQLRNRSCFEIAIGQENFIMSVELISKIFKVKA